MGCAQRASISSLACQHELIVRTALTIGLLRGNLSVVCSWYAVALEGGLRPCGWCCVVTQSAECRQINSMAYVDSVLSSFHVLWVLHA